MSLQLSLDTILTRKKINEREKNYFRPIHYLGSKLRVLDQINDIISNIACEGDHVVDLFSGSGTVSNYLSNYYSVTANDIQNYSRIINEALLCNNDISETLGENFLNRISNSDFKNQIKCIQNLIDFEKEAAIESYIGNNEKTCEIIELGSIISGEAESKSGIYTSISQAKSKIAAFNARSEYNDFIVTKYFGGVYFSYQQAFDIDTILHEISKLDCHRDFFKAVLLSTVSEVVSSVGKHFAQPIRPRHKDGRIKKGLAKSLDKNRKLCVYSIYKDFLKSYIENSKNKYSNNVFRKDFSEVIMDLTDPKVIYADPPYTRDHYSRFYHVLETIALQDNPKLSTVKINGIEKNSRGLYRQDRHQSPFCIRSKAGFAFEKMFQKTRDKKSALVLSYSPFNETKAHPRVMDIDTLVLLGKKYFSNIDVLSAGEIRHSKLNHSSLHLDASTEAEIFLIMK